MANITLKDIEIKINNKKKIIGEQLKIIIGEIKRLSETIPKLKWLSNSDIKNKKMCTGFSKIIGKEEEVRKHPNFMQLKAQFLICIDLYEEIEELTNKFNAHRSRVNQLLNNFKVTHPPIEDTSINERDIEKLMMYDTETELSYESNEINLLDLLLDLERLNLKVEDITLKSHSRGYDGEYIVTEVYRKTTREEVIESIKESNKSKFRNQTEEYNRYLKNKKEVEDYLNNLPQD